MMVSLLIPSPALITACLPDWPVLDWPARQRVQKDVIAFVRRELALVPWFIALPMLLVQTAFLVAARLRHHGTAFGNLSHDRQTEFMALWARGGMPLQALLRLYRSLTLLGFMEHNAVRAACGLTDYHTHQALFRQRRRDQFLPESTV